MGRDELKSEVLAMAAAIGGEKVLEMVIDAMSLGQLQRLAKSCAEFDPHYRLRRDAIAALVKLGRSDAEATAIVDTVRKQCSLEDFGAFMVACFRADTELRKE